MAKHTVRVVLALVTVAMIVVGSGRVLADDGDALTTLRTDDHVYIIYKGLDAQADVTAAGTGIYLGAWDKLTFWPISGVDAGDTWEVDCGVSGSSTAAPTTWITVQAETSDTTAKRMEPGDMCEWVRVNKPTDTNDSTTVYVVVARRVR